MIHDALMVDFYQIASLFAHETIDVKKAFQRVQMSFFSRKLPDKRNYIMFAGLRSILQHMKKFNHCTISQVLWDLSCHPMLSSVLSQHADIFAALDFDDFNLMSMKEGTLAFAAPGYTLDDKPFEIRGNHIQVYEPYMQVETSLILSKFIETPWLSYINYMSMVASKASRIVGAAQDKPVMEFGQRRTHPYAAIDAAYAAHIAGCSATSNVAAFLKYGIPAVGTMDHFAVMASEKDTDKDAAELEFFAAFAKTFPDNATLLVDTYDTSRGIRNAVKATDGKLIGIRIDSNVSIDRIKSARQLLASLGTPHVKIFVSDGLDEYKIKELTPYVDGFGVGENITCSPDSATGVGAVGKLIVNGYGKNTIKVAENGGKMTLPGPIQVYRTDDYDLVTLLDESAPKFGYPLLHSTKVSASLENTRAFAKSQIDWLPRGLKSINDYILRKIYVSDAFANLTHKLAE